MATLVEKLQQWRRALLEDQNDLERERDDLVSSLNLCEKKIENAKRNIADVDRALAVFDDPPEPVEHISVLTGDPAIEPETGLHGEGYAPVTQAHRDDHGYQEHAEEERRREGWIPADEFVFPASSAIVEARWEDGVCELLTHEPEWATTRSDLSGANALKRVTHYRMFALPTPEAEHEPLADPIWNEPQQERPSPFNIFQPEREQ